MDVGKTADSGGRSAPQDLRVNCNLCLEDEPDWRYVCPTRINGHRFPDQSAPELDTIRPAESQQLGRAIFASNSENSEGQRGLPDIAASHCFNFFATSAGSPASRLLEGVVRLGCSIWRQVS